ncbi:actin nucleation-promoting factor WAS-like isoform X1 [Lethenteron reissneri]|uniref:actin nucleation-promoting factor WAS-like isoform X1 n=1 Tax=Lethenteron reissneri TaxID=7753 RepID=UPI002AB6FF57|nr:actin nucleation-promoting factor WAS-like isoform X1 [Lethenteron reissneri]
MSAADRSKKEKMNVGSSFLNAEQNEILFSLLGHKCTTLVSTMVIVFLHEGGQWMRKHYGVVCFVKDGSKKSYFIRVYSVGDSRQEESGNGGPATRESGLKEHGLLWEQELEKTLKYKAAHEIFHTVYSKDKKAALCFENEAEAADFKTIVIEKLHLLCPGNSKPASGALPAKFDTLPGRLSPIHKDVSLPPPLPSRLPNGPPQLLPTRSPHTLPRNTNQNDAPPPTGAEPVKKNKYWLKMAEKIGKPTKEISGPQDFQHNHHIAWDPLKGFDIKNIPDEMKAVFMKAGINEQQLTDKKSSKAIREVLNIYGLVDTDQKKTECEHTSQRSCDPRNPQTPRYLMATNTQKSTAESPNRFLGVDKFPSPRSKSPEQNQDMVQKLNNLQQMLHQLMMEGLSTNERRGSAHPR